MSSLRLVLAGFAAVALAAAHSPAAPASPPARASGSDQPAGKHCVVAEEATIRAAGDSGGEMKFSAAFYRRMYNLEVSLEGADGNELPLSLIHI